MRRIPVLAAAAVWLFVAAAPALATEGEVKTLDDIRIEGEIQLPRVLFITSTGGERPLDFLEHFAGQGSGRPAPTGPVPLIDAGLAPAEDTTPNEAANEANTEPTVESEEVHP